MITVIKKILQKITKDIKNIFIRDKKRFILQNLPYLFFIYLGNIFSVHIGTYRGGDIVDKIFKAVLEISRISFIPSFHIVDISAGLLVATLVKIIIYTKLKNAKKFRKGKEYGSARWVA